MEFCSKYGYNYGFHGSDSEDCLDEAINSFGKKTQKFRKADSNIIAVKFDKLDKPNAVKFTKPFICNECSAILSLLSKVKKADNKIEWKCEFCETINNFETEFFGDLVPNEDDITYYLNEIQKLSITNNSKYLIFCIDVSGSMDTCTNGKSILNEVKQACIDNLVKLESKQPDIKVGLVTFSQEVKFYGDCSSASPYICYELNDKDKLLKIAQEHNDDLMNVSRSKNNILKCINQIKTEGRTALGPGLVFSIGFSGKIPGSEVILCTDGIANVGMGDSNDSNFYDKLAEDAKKRGVRVSVISIEGCETNLQILGKIADKSNGSVNIVDPANLAENFRSIINNEIIATNVKVKLIVSKKLMYVRDEEVEIAETAALAANDLKKKEELNMTKKSVGVKDIGNANIESEIFFEYGIRKLNDSEVLNEMPFQLQISYTLKSGCNAIRVYSKIQQFKSDRKIVEKHLNNKSIILCNATQKISNCLLTSNHELARHKSNQIKNYKEINYKELPNELIQLTELIEKSTKNNELNKMDDKLAKEIYNCKQMTSKAINEKSTLKCSPSVDEKNEDQWYSPTEEIDGDNKGFSGGLFTKGYFASELNKEDKNRAQEQKSHLKLASHPKMKSPAKKSGEELPKLCNGQELNDQKNLILHGQMEENEHNLKKLDKCSQLNNDVFFSSKIPPQNTCFKPNNIKLCDASSSLIGNIPGTDVYESLEICKEAIEFQGIKIIRYEDSLYSSNVENFKYQMSKLSSVNPNFMHSDIRNLYKQEFKKLMGFYNKQKSINWRSKLTPDDLKTYIIDKDGIILLKENQQNVRNQCKYEIVSSSEIKHVILDCSSMIYVDSQGVETIRNLYLDYREVDVVIYLSHCKEHLKKTFDKYSLHEDLDIDKVFDSTHEAVRNIFDKNDNAQGGAQEDVLPNIQSILLPKKADEPKSSASKKQ